jgi:hypothetical protein
MFRTDESDLDSTESQPPSTSQLATRSRLWQDFRDLWFGVIRIARLYP